MSLKHEYRFGVVLYGGVSLAVYINGVCQELASMVRGSRRDQLREGTDAGSSTEPVYRLAASLDPNPQVDNPDFDTSLSELRSGAGSTKAEPVRRFTIDILSGTSAGGLNSIYLAKSLVFDLDMEGLKTLWTDDADLAGLLEDETSYAQHRGKQPLHSNVAMSAEPGSVLSGDLMYLKLFDALETMDNAKNVATDKDGLVEALDCYLTTTDLRGTPFPLRLSGQTTVEEAHHRTVFHFVRGTTEATGGDRNDFRRTSHASLAFAARATSAFPFAFEPAQGRQVDADLARWLGPDPHWDTLARDPFLSDRTKPASADNWAWDMSFRWYSDGGDMDNKPFSYVLGPLARRRAEIPVTRKLLYIEPDPEDPAGRYLKRLGRPSIRESVLDAYSLGRFEAIRSDIENIRQRNALVDRLKASIGEQIANRTVSTVESAPERSFTSNEQETEAWLRMSRHEMLDRPGGSRDLAYERFKARLVAAELGDILNAIARLSQDSAAGQFVRDFVSSYVERTWLAESTADDGPGMPHRAFLHRFDLSFRLRRLVFLEQIVAQLQDDVLDPTISTSKNWGLTGKLDFDSLRDLRRELNQLYAHLRAIGRHLRTGHPEDAYPHRRHLFDSGDVASSLQIATGTLAGWATADRLVAIERESPPPGDAGWDGLVREICGEVSEALDPWFRVTQQQATSVFGGFDEELKDLLDQLWGEFALYDNLILPHWETARGELAHIDVVRISPRDARRLVPVTKIPGHEVDKLGGNALGHFGGFLSQKWRANDVLWGRLDAAEVLIHSLVPEVHLDEQREMLIAEAHRRIFLAEEKAVKDLPSLSIAGTNETLDPAQDQKVVEFLQRSFAINRRLTGAPPIGRTIEVLRRLSTEHGRNGRSRSSRWIGRLVSVPILLLQFAFPVRSWDKFGRVVIFVGSIASAYGVYVNIVRSDSDALIYLAAGSAAIILSGLAALFRRSERGVLGMALGLVGLGGLVTVVLGARLDPHISNILLLGPLAILAALVAGFAFWAPGRLQLVGAVRRECEGTLVVQAPCADVYDQLLEMFELDRTSRRGSPYRLATDTPLEGRLLDAVDDRRLILTMEDRARPRLPTTIIGFTMTTAADDRATTTVTFRHTGLPPGEWTGARNRWRERLEAMLGAPRRRRILRRNATGAPTATAPPENTSVPHK